DSRKPATRAQNTKNTIGTASAASRGVRPAVATGVRSNTAPAHANAPTTAPGRPNPSDADSQRSSATAAPTSTTSPVGAGSHAKSATPRKAASAGFVSSVSGTHT